MWFGLLLRLWLWLFRVRGGFVCPLRWFAFGVGFGRPVAVVSFVINVGSRLVLVLVLRVWLSKNRHSKTEFPTIREPSNIGRGN